MLFMPILSFILFLPIISIFIILIIRGKNENTYKNIKLIAILASGMHFILTIFLWTKFDKVSFGYQFTERMPLISKLDMSYYLGIDGVSLIFLSFSSLIIFIVLLFAKSPKNQSKLFCISYLTILSGLTGTFASLDIIMFYIFYEVSIIPVFFIIGMLGGHNKVYATYKFMLYTIAASILMLVAIISMVSITGTASIVDLTNFNFSSKMQTYLFWGMFIAFGVKVALVPVHTWMPDTYASAPISLNIILSAILMKYGVYGIIRFIIPMFPSAVVEYSMLVYIIAWVTLIYTALIAFKQENIRLFLAYFSISHVALIIAGIFATNTQGLEGALYQSISHSIFNTGIFLSIIYIQRRKHVENISDFTGLASVMPKLCLAMFIFVLAAIGFPLTNAFIGEFLILFGIFQDNRTIAVLFVLSILVSAIVGITFIRKILFGSVSPHFKDATDINFKEVAILTCIITLIFFMGIYPNFVLDVVRTSISNIYEQFITINNI